ncbi:MAG: hypothetical protein ACT4QE_13165 [Anaerolineales bacterium]
MIVRPLLSLLITAWLVGCANELIVTTPTVPATRTPTPTPPATPSPVSSPTVEDPSTPLIIQLSMAKAPKLDEEVDVVLEIRAYRDAPGTTAELVLPSQARLISGELNWQGDVSVDQPVRLTIRIAFTQTGEYVVEANALRVIDADMIWGDNDSIFLTVKQDSGQFGWESAGTPQLSASPVP